MLSRELHQNTICPGSRGLFYKVRKLLYKMGQDILDILGDPEVTPNIYYKSRNFPITDTKLQYRCAVTSGSSSTVKKVNNINDLSLLHKNVLVRSCSVISNPETRTHSLKMNTFAGKTNFCKPSLFSHKQHCLYFTKTIFAEISIYNVEEQGSMKLLS